MKTNNHRQFEQFLNMSVCDYYEYFTRQKLNPWEKLYLNFIVKQWTIYRKINPYIKAYDLWESMRKVRF